MKRDRRGCDILIIPQIQNQTNKQKETKPPDINRNPYDLVTLILPKKVLPNSIAVSEEVRRNTQRQKLPNNVVANETLEADITPTHPSRNPTQPTMLNIYPKDPKLPFILAPKMQPNHRCMQLRHPSLSSL